MTTNRLVDEEKLKQWQSQKKQAAFVEAALQAMGLDADAVNANLRAYKKLLQARRNFTGFMCMGIGAFVGFISCLLAILNPVPEWHNFFLFGLTGIAVLVVFIGLYLVFE